MWNPIQERKTNEKTHGNSKTSTGGEEANCPRRNTCSNTRKSTPIEIKLIIETYDETVKSSMPQEFTKYEEFLIETCEEKEDTNLDISKKFLFDGKSIRTGITTTDTLHENATTLNCTELDNHIQRSKEIDQVVNQLLDALNEDNIPTTHEEKQKIISQYYHSGEDFGHLNK